VLVAVALVVLLIVTALFGNFHVVSSSSRGTFLVSKIHFTLAETFVSLDSIMGQTRLTAYSQYPLAVRALQRDGILESDEAAEARLKREIEAAGARLKREIEASFSDY
jgi:hypothetical protein